MNYYYIKNEEKRSISLEHYPEFPQIYLILKLMVAPLHNCVKSINGHFIWMIYMNYQS